MNLLLDTHVLIWALENNATLSNPARESIIKGENMVFVSAVSVWEISVKQALGKLCVPDNLLEEIRVHRFTSLAINPLHALLAGQLPPLHKDPFDRMLIAQAMIEKLTIVSRDRIMRQYDVTLIKA